MLDQDYRRLLAKLIETLPDDIELPPEQEDFFEESGPLPSYEHEQRAAARTRVRTRGVLVSQQDLPAFPRSKEPRLIYTRDFSKTGFGFVASHQYYPGEVVRVILATFWMSVRVRRSLRVGPNCFQVGGTLNHQFDPSEEAFHDMSIPTCA